METLDTHFLLTVYILYKRTKFPPNIVFTSQSHKVAYFYDVGALMQLTKKSIICTMIEQQSLKHMEDPHYSNGNILVLFVRGWIHRNLENISMAINRNCTPLYFFESELMSAKSISYCSSIVFTTTLAFLKDLLVGF